MYIWEIYLKYFWKIQISNIKIIITIKYVIIKELCLIIKTKKMYIEFLHLILFLKYFLKSFYCSWTTLVCGG